MSLTCPFRATVTVAHERPDTRPGPSKTAGGRRLTRVAGERVRPRQVLVGEPTPKMKEDPMAQTVRELMTGDPLTVDVNDTLAQAARQMRDADVGALIVTHSGDLRGVVTDRDITV